METRRIAVVGAGANGGSIAADLINAGVSVELVEQWPEHVEAMRHDGLEVQMPEGVLRVPVSVHHLCEVATFTDPFDVILLVMKAYDTRWACELVTPLLKPNGLLVGIQNGMTTDVIADVVGPERTVGAALEISSTLAGPGVVDRHSGPSRSWFAIGGIHEATAGREVEIAELLRHSGSVEIVDDIRAVKWMKLVSNCTTLVTSALLGVSIAEAAAIPRMRAIMLESGREALRAGRRLGYSLMPILGLKPSDLDDGGGDVVELLLKTLLGGFVLPSTASTILYDWKHSRRSEVHDINGSALRAMTDSGSVPINAAIVSLASDIERHELAPSVDNLERLLEMIGSPPP